MSKDNNPTPPRTYNPEARHQTPEERLRKLIKDLPPKVKKPPKT